MNCKDCGAEVANIGELNRHKKECPGRTVTTAKVEAEAKVETEVKQEKCTPVIPWEMCDPNLAVLSLGTLVTGVIIGTVAKDGIEIREVHPMRRSRKTG